MSHSGTGKQCFKLKKSPEDSNTVYKIIKVKAKKKFVLYLLNKYSTFWNGMAEFEFYKMYKDSI